MDAKSLRAPLEDVVRRIRHCYVVAENLGDQTSRISAEGAPLVNPTINSFFHRIWLSGDSLQFETTVEAASAGDWKNTNISAGAEPNSQENINIAADVITCLRSDLEFVHVDIRPYAPARASSQGCQGLYTMSRNYDHRFHFYLPLLDLHREWATTPSTWFAINEVYLSSLDDWKILPLDSRDDASEAIVEIEDSPQLVYSPARDPDRGNLREGDELHVIPIKRVTFSRVSNGKYYPTKIVNLRKWSFRGEQYEVDDMEDTCVVVFQARDWTEFDDGLVFPKSGFQETYRRAHQNETLDVNAFARKVIDSILSGKKLKPNDGGKLLENRREWSIHSLEAIEPRESLWIEPVPEFCILDQQTGERVIPRVGNSIPDQPMKEQRPPSADSRLQPSLPFWLGGLAGLGVLIVFLYRRRMA